MLALTKVLLNFDRGGGSSFSWQINCSWRCQSWWTISINIKSKRCCTTFVPAASSVHRLLRWCRYDVTLYMLVAACLHAPIYPSMDVGLIVNINYEVLDAYRARPFGSVMWSMARERVFLLLSLSQSFLSFSFSSLAWKFHKVSEFISTGVTFDKFQTDALHLVKIYTPRPIK